MAFNTKTMPVSVYALGGLGEVGKNTYCIENEKTLIMIDAGVRFPEEDLPGVDYVIPDYTHLKNNRSKIKALFYHPWSRRPYWWYSFFNSKRLYPCHLRS